MNAPRGGGKKRKQADAGDAERTLYGSFVHAANAVSQLYTAAVQQSKRSEEQGARQALERVAQFVVKEYGNAPAVPTAVLMEVLRQELQAAQGSVAAIPMPFPVPLLPLSGGDSSDAHSDDEHLMSAEPAPGHGFRRTTSSHQISPPKARAGGGGGGMPGHLPAMFQQMQQQQMQQHLHLHHQQQQQMQQQQQQQQHAMVQQQQAAAAAGAQSQQQPGFMPGYGVPPF